MNVLFLTEGGGGMGLGHLARCLALAEGIREQTHKRKRNCQINFIFKGDKAAEVMFQDRDFNFAIKDWIKTPEALDERLREADLAVIDSYLAPSRVYRYLFRASPLTRFVYVDDYNRLEYPPGTVVNPTIYAHLLDYSPTPPGGQTAHLCGRDYVILRRGFWGRSAKRVKKVATDVLLTCGIIRHEDFAKKLMGTLSAHYPNLTYHVLASESNSNFNHGLNVKMHSALSSQSLRRLLLKIDVAISAGGQTTYELARVGVPAIGISFAENQGLNLLTLQRKGLIRYIGFYREKALLSKLMKSFSDLSKYKERAQLSKRCREYIDGKGAKRLADRFIKLCEENAAMGVR